MSDRRRPKGAKNLPNSTVASARVLPEKPRRNEIAAPPGWAEEAWSYYDSVGEVRTCASWYSNGLSRVRLGLARRGRGGEEPELLPPDDPRNELLEGLAGGETGQSQLLSSFGPQLVVPGEGYLVAVDDEILGRTSKVLSTSELKATENGYEWRNEDGKWTPVPEDVLPVLIRRPHARYHNQADSPIRAVLPVLRELSLLSAHVDAAATSRLAGAGVLAIPSEATFPVSPHNADAEDPFLAELMDSILEPIANRDHPSAVVPVVMRVPGEHLEKIKHLTFSTPFDDKALGLREEAIRRFANGVDMPASILLGIESANHWTAWQIEESGIKLHLVPMLETIVQGITLGWWRPLCQAAADAGHPVDEAEDLIVWYDLSGLTVRPDRSGDAKDLYQLPDAPLKLEALMRETGFDSGDMADESERFKLFATRLLASRPDMAEQLLPIVFPTASKALDRTPEARPIAAPTEVIEVERVDPGSAPAGNPDAPVEGAAPDGTLTLEQVERIAVVAQKLYLAVGKLMTAAEAREILRQAGAPVTAGDLPPITETVEQAAAEVPIVEDSDPVNSIPERPDGPPDEAPPGTVTASAADLVVDVFEGIAFRALEHAGNRLRNKARATSSAPSAPAVEVHLHHRPAVADLDRLLDGVWARVPEVATRYGLDPEAVETVLDGYVRGLLRGQTPHDLDGFRTLFLDELGVIP